MALKKRYQAGESNIDPNSQQNAKEKLSGDEPAEKNSYRIEDKGKRLTIGAVDGVAGFRRLVADSPSGGREFSDSIDGKIGQARKHRAQIVAN
jgi:hypothetical protein